MPDPVSQQPPPAPTWVFGYGSLMWQPGFPCVAKRPALLRGYRRSYVMLSTRNRGTWDRPGMGLSVVPGGEVVGMAHAIEPGAEAAAFAYLDQREGADRANKRVLMPIRWHDAPDAPMATAWTYLPIHGSCNFVPGVPHRRKAELIAQGRGKTGSAYDYLRLVLETLAPIGVREPALEQLLADATHCLGTHSVPEDAVPEAAAPGPAAPEPDEARPTAQPAPAAD